MEKTITLAEKSPRELARLALRMAREMAREVEQYEVDEGYRFDQSTNMVARRVWQYAKSAFATVQAGVDLEEAMKSLGEHFTLRVILDLDYHIDPSQKGFVEEHIVEALYRHGVQPELERPVRYPETETYVQPDHIRTTVEWEDK